MGVQLRDRKSQFLYTTTSESLQVARQAPARRSFISSLWFQVRLHRYRFETTFGPYVMDTGEKIVFYLIFFVVLCAVIMLVYYALSFVLSQTAPSVQSTVREFLHSEIPKLRVEPMAANTEYQSLDYQGLEKGRPSMVAI